MNPEMSVPLSVYQQRIAGYAEQTERLRRPLSLVPWLRLVLIVGAGILLYDYFRDHDFLFITGAVLLFAGFLAAGWYDARLKTGIRKLSRLTEINEREIRALGYDFSGFNPGNGFVSQDHPYTYDLDIFGIGSLYQFLNRSSTIFGGERLARYCSNAFDYRGEIRERQAAIGELAAQVEFRQQLQLIFMDQDTSQYDLQALTEWLDRKEELQWLRPAKALAVMLPAITLVTIILSAAAMLPYQVPVMMVLLQMMIVFIFGRRTQEAHQRVTPQVGILKKYALALSLAGGFPFSAGYNKKLQDALRSDGNRLPGRVIHRLSQLLNMMDSNLNLLVSVIMNGLFMFNIHVLAAVERWRVQNRELVPKWFGALAEIDALASLGNFAFNNPSFTYPEPVSDNFRFVAEKMGHPLIPPGTCVTNDLDIAGWKQFRIITGANMSGKSTFLRTVGVNLVLAMAGAPVFASRLVFYPIEIHSSIRTNDSLAKRESYFYAELRRLREIITGLECGQQKLILLDEILKGTNSADKQSGSIALIRQLMKYKLAGLFATHDLALGELVNHYPDNLKNLCFEIHIAGDQMEIDYKLAPGVCRNLNASFLMKNMGIILDDEAPAKGVHQE
ncbi:MAG: hypothetical protein WCO44_13925 [Bacteroidota bacterium]